MYMYLLIGALSLALTACDGRDKPHTAQGKIQNDNTEKNVRDQNANAKGPFDQSESEADRTVTQKIRQAIMADNSLSTNAKNIKIITINGVVTLRGPVANAQEKDNIAQKVKNIQGIVKVDNQLEINKK